MTSQHHYTTTAQAQAAAPECLSEHLNYFSENFQQASSFGAPGNEFDDIFTKDFDLVFDPILLMNSDEATVARPVAMPQAGHHNQHQQQHQAPRSAHPAPTPMAVPSHSFVPTTTQQPKSRSFVPAPTVVIKAPIRKIAPPTVSPTSVATVFESIPAPPSVPVVQASSPRKRSYSMVSAPAPVPSSTPAPAAAPASEPAVDTSNMSFQEQEDLRRERNRHHAKRSRQRKRTYMTQLEEAVNEMRKENERLFDILALDSRKAKVDMKEEEERKAARATDKFIAGLKQPRNRVLDNTTLAFLRELWK